ncbi:hypothetical protein PSTT_14877, partial [Puccinia striiformis]
ESGMIELDPSSLLPYLDNSPNEQTCRTKNRNRTRRRRQHCYSPIGGRWILYSIIILLSLLVGRSNGLMTSKRKLELRDLVKKTWYHGYDNYMKHAFPDDELRPLSCTGIGQDHENPNNHETNDVLGDFSMTLIDTLDTFVALRDVENFRLAVWRIVEQIPSFDLNSKVQVFETTIRVLGGLLSGHLFAQDPQNLWGHRIDGYQDQLLFLAKDLADRILPAFNSSTGIPYARINLRHGVLPGEGTETCTAGAGSLLLEFATLSRLLGDPIYENAARKAFYALWDRRSMINLFGNTIDIQTGQWAYGVSSIGAGIDSFYEYILKSHILLQDNSLLEMWNQAYKAVMTYMRSPDGFWYRGVNMQTGAVATTTIDSLGRFLAWLTTAIQSHLTYVIFGPGAQKFIYPNFNSFNKPVDLFSMANTRSFDIHRKQATSLGYPLRPEFIESNYFLIWLPRMNIIWKSLNVETRIGNIRLVIRNIEIFYISHSMRKIPLTMSMSHSYLPPKATFLHSRCTRHAAKPGYRTGWEERESLESDRVYERPTAKPNKTTSKPKPVHSKHSNPLKLSITDRTDFDYARMITGSMDSVINSNHSFHHLDDNLWSNFGFCEVPAVDDHVIELIFSYSADDIERNQAGKVEFYGTSSSNASIKIVTIVGVGSYILSAKTQVILTDPYAIKVLKPQTESEKISQRDRDHLTGIRVYYEDLTSTNSQEPTEARPVMMATFGPDVRVPGSTNLSVGNEPLEVVGLNPPNEYGCMPIMGNTPESLLQKKERVEDLHGKVILIKRGECTFADKVQNAVLAGAHGIIVANQDDNLLIPTSDRIKSRDEKENESILFQKQHSSSPSPTGDGRSEAPVNEPPALKIEDDDHQLNEKLKSIPLLFSTLETGRSMGQLLANRRLSSSDPLKNRKLMIEIVTNPLDLLDRTNPNPVTNPLDPSTWLVINGYKLSNLILQS